MGNPKRAGINLVRCRICQRNVYEFWKDAWREITSAEVKGIAFHGEVYESVCPACCPDAKKEGE